MSAGTRLKLVFYKGRVRVFLGKREIPISRLPDLVPIYLDKVNPDAGGAVVLEGYAWYGEGEDWFDNYLLPSEMEDEEGEMNNGDSEEIVMKEKVVQETTSSDGRFSLRLIENGKGRRLEVVMNYGNRVYRTIITSSLDKLHRVLSPDLLLVRMGFSVSDVNVRKIIVGYLSDRKIRDFIRRVSSYS